MPFDVTPEPSEPRPEPPEPPEPPVSPAAAPSVPEDAGVPTPAPMSAAYQRGAASSPLAYQGSSPLPAPPEFSRPFPADRGPLFAPPPHRRAMGKVIGLVIAGVLVVGGVGVAMGSGSSDGGGSAGNDGGSGTRVHAVGQAVDLGDVSFTVLGARTLPAGPFSEPTAGHVYLAVHIEVVNNGSGPEVVSSLMQFSVRDATGLSYDQTYAEGAVGSLDGFVAPGSKLRGEIVYEVPEGATGLQLVISDFFAGSVTVQLN